MIKNNAFASKRRDIPQSVKVARKKLGPLKRLSLEFSHLTTCHGFRQIAAPNRRLVYRLLWGSVVIGLFCGLATELYHKFLEYNYTETVTDLHEEYVNHLEFPAVTLCNSNRFETEAEEIEFSKINALVQAASYHKHHGDYDNTWWTKAVESFHKDHGILGKKHLFLSEELTLHGWKLNDSTLRHCAFEKKQCSIENFTKIITAMGVCYTFTPEAYFTQRVAGSGHGLELYIDINQFEYTLDENSNITSGVKVMIHKRGDPPMVERYAPMVASGHTAHITLKKTERHLMYKPWGQCEQEHKELIHHEKYTIASCMDECHVQFIIDRCDCKPFWDSHFEAPECDVWHVLNCAGKAEVEFPLNETAQSCGCTIPCNFETYEPAGTADFPGIEVAEFLASHAYRNESVTNLDQVDFAFEQLQRHGKDHVMLDIFYDELSYITITQRKALSDISLMSDVGGLLGLWLGISFVTIAEFLQFGLDCFELSMGWKKGYRRKDIKTKTAVSFAPDLHFGVENKEDIDKEEKESDNESGENENRETNNTENNKSDFSEF